MQKQGVAMQPPEGVLKLIAPLKKRLCGLAFFRKTLVLWDATASAIWPAHYLELKAESACDSVTPEADF